VTRAERQRLVRLGSPGLLGSLRRWPFVEGWVRRRRSGSKGSVDVGIVALLAIIGLTP